MDGEFVARMEDVLDLYAEPPDAKRPVVCFVGRSPFFRQGLCDRDESCRIG